MDINTSQTSSQNGIYNCCLVSFSEVKSLAERAVRWVVRHNTTHSYFKILIFNMISSLFLKRENHFQKGFSGKSLIQCCVMCSYMNRTILYFVYFMGKSYYIHRPMPCMHFLKLNLLFWDKDVINKQMYEQVSSEKFCQFIKKDLKCQNLEMHI